MMTVNSSETWLAVVCVCVVYCSDRQNICFLEHNLMGSEDLRSVGQQNSTPSRVLGGHL